MARQGLMLRFARWHIWLGWLVGVPMLMWALTGLLMVVRPIEDVRGEALRAPPPTIAGATYALPEVGEPIVRATLVQQPMGPVWLVVTADGDTYRYDARAGWLAPPVVEAEARQIAAGAYAGRARLRTLTYFPADTPPGELRAAVPSWQAHFADGTNLYIDAQTGEVLAVRTDGWRFYDLMWGLHIMNLQDREDAHHPIIIAFAGLAVLGALLGCILMFRRRKARVKA
jgi:uncharacterized iron-regulated membrane protein